MTNTSEKYERTQQGNLLRMASPKRMNFWKELKRPYPPLHFRKIMLQSFYQFHAQKALFKGRKPAT